MATSRSEVIKLEGARLGSWLEHVLDAEEALRELGKESALVGGGKLMHIFAGLPNGLSIKVQPGEKTTLLGGNLDQGQGKIDKTTYCFNETEPFIGGRKMYATFGREGAAPLSERADGYLPAAYAVNLVCSRPNKGPWARSQPNGVIIPSALLAEAVTLLVVDGLPTPPNSPQTNSQQSAAPVVPFSQAA